MNKKKYIYHPLTLLFLTLSVAHLLTSCHDDLTEVGANELKLTRGYSAEQIQIQR